MRAVDDMEMEGERAFRIIGTVLSGLQGQYKVRKLCIWVHTVHKYIYIIHTYIHTYIHMRDLSHARARARAKSKSEQPTPNERTVEREPETLPKKHDAAPLCLSFC